MSAYTGANKNTFYWASFMVQSISFKHVLQSYRWYPSFILYFQVVWIWNAIYI